MPLDNGKLIVRKTSSENLSAFLFEPSELVPFETALRWQKNWQNLLLSENVAEQAVWFLQHSSCYTLGRGASESNLLFDPNDPPLNLYRADRGGEVTHHMPGQLVVYPVLNLRFYKTDLHWYLRELEGVLIHLLRLLGLKGERIPGLTGVWVRDRKVAAIGVGCRRWITQHGLALNVDCDLYGYRAVVPCGLEEHPIGRLIDWIPGITVKEVQPLLKNCFSKTFGLDWDNYKG